MRPREGFFPARDGLRLYFRAYLPASPSGLFIILHGHGEHLGRHEAVAEMLAGMNFAAALFDSRGHGRSEGPQAHAGSFRDYLDDLSVFLAFLKANFEVPSKIYLLGQSRGGLVAAAWALENPGTLKGMVLVSPCFDIPLAAPLKALNAFVNLIAPAFCWPRPIDPRKLSRDPDIVRAYKADPQVRRKISARVLAEMLSWGSEIARKKPLEYDCPVVILAAGDDKVVRLEETRRFYERLSAPRKEMKVFPGYHHEIMLDKGREEVLAALKAQAEALRAQNA